MTRTRHAHSLPYKGPSPRPARDRSRAYSIARASGIVKSTGRSCASHALAGRFIWRHNTPRDVGSRGLFDEVKTVRTIKVAVLLGAFGLLVGHVQGQGTVRDHDLVPEDYFTLGVVSGVAASPDGRYVAYTETRWEPPAEKRNTDIWLVERSTKEVRRLTFDAASDSSPLWAPDSKQIYFRSGRKRGEEKDPPYNGKAQVWRMAIDGGEPQAITRAKDGVGLFDLAGDGRALYYTTTSENIDDEWKDLKKKYGDLEYGHGVTKVSSVWRLDLVHWRTKKIVDEKRTITSLAIAPDERRVGMVTKPDASLLTAEGWSTVDVYDAESDAVTTLTADGWRKDHPSPFGWIDGVAFAADGNAIAWTISFDGFPTQLYVAEWSGTDAQVAELERPSDVTLTGHPLVWRGGGRDLCFIGEDHARARVYAIQSVRHGKQGRTVALTKGDVTVHGFGFAASGNPLAVVMASPEHDRDVFAVSDQGHYDRLADVNAHTATWKLPQISIVKWEGANGDTVEGILELPFGYKEGDGPLPMVVEIHGGPTAATLYEFRFWIYGRSLMPAQGYAVLSPNYRGSTGYGDKFMVELVGRENDIEVEDILKGVDAMVHRGIADPDRLGVMGWSNGGYLTNCLIARTDRFKAASSGAGVLDQVIQWGTEDTPGHVINYMKSLPWSNPAAYEKGSPLYRLDKVKTPTIIHVGENDPRVPPAHARALFRGLHHYLKVPTELVVYPDEGHGLTTYTHRKAKMEWDLAWFAKYLNPPTGEPEPETRANDSQ